jgi:hypothetical protein
MSEKITAESLFAGYFWPAYPPDVQAEPDRFKHLDANPANNPALAAVLPEAAELFVHNARGLLDVTLTFDDAGIRALSKALTRVRRDAWIADGSLRDVLIHASAFVGETMVRCYGGVWELRRPMWESLVRRKTRGSVSPFHWLLKSLADDAIDLAPLSDRWNIHVVLDATTVTSLSVLTTAKRLPSVKNPTYDLLVKYLHAHLPTLKDVGAGFPSPVEFSERKYPVMGVEILHEGRVIALHGQIQGEGERPPLVEIIWLTATGFHHADSLPCDANIAHFARAITEEILEVTLAWKGKPTTHRLSLRGHV